MYFASFPRIHHSTYTRIYVHVMLCSSLKPYFLFSYYVLFFPVNIIMMFHLKKKIFFKVHVMFVSVYLSSLSVAHLSDAPRSAPRRRLVVTGDTARIQDETTESSAWFFSVLGV